ncbi:MAG: Sec-independent protein translocase protein TatB [Pseudomonadota bacterium]
MFDLGWSEMAIIMLVALIVIGPRDLPRVARTVGRWSAKGRSLMREFQRSMDEMAREAELDDIKKEIDKAGRVDIRKSIERSIDPDGSLKSAFDVNDKKSKKKATEAESLKIADDGVATASSPEEKAFNAEAALSDAERYEGQETLDEIGPDYPKAEPEPVTSSPKS